MSEEAEKLSVRGPLSVEDADQISSAVSSRLRTLRQRSTAELTKEDKNLIDTSVAMGARNMLELLDQRYPLVLPFSRDSIKNIRGNIWNLINQGEGNEKAETLPTTDEIVEDGSKIVGLLSAVADGRYGLTSSDINRTQLEDLGIAFQDGFAAFAVQNAGINAAPMSKNLEYLLMAHDASVEKGVQPNLSQ